MNNTLYKCFALVCMQLSLLYRDTENAPLAASTLFVAHKMALGVVRFVICLSFACYGARIADSKITVSTRPIGSTSEGRPCLPSC